MDEETEKACGKAESVRFCSGKTSRFRLQAPEEAAIAEYNALDRKLADEDFDPYS